MTIRNVPTRSTATSALSLAQFVRFRDLIEDRCGLHLDEGHRGSLSESLRVRMTQLNLDRVDDYYDHLRSRPSDDAFRKLVNLVTVTETCFFRDPAQFRLLRRHVLPTLLAECAAAGRSTLRIWSAGCSSGDEAYSIALTLCDMGSYAAYPNCKVEIVGTDVNTEVLEAAGRAEYSARALRNVDGDRLRRYFRRVGPKFRLNDEVRRLVRFEYGNLTRTPMSSAAPRYDIVLCKNVAIYFRPERTRRLLRDLHEVVTDGGYLLLGHSESLWQLADGFSLIEHDGAFCYRKVSAMPEAAEPGRRPSSRRLRSGPEKAGPPGASGMPRRGAPRAMISPAPLQSSLETAGGQYERCLAACRAEAWAEAEASLRALIASNPQFVPAHLLLGGVFAHRGRYEEASQQAEHVLRLNDLEPRAHLLQGMMAAGSGRLDEARGSFRRALYLNDSLALAHFWLGNLYRDSGDIDRARSEYENVVRDWERHTLDFTEEFASDLSAEQIVDFCRHALRRLQPGE